MVKMYREDLDSFKLKGLLLLPQTAESVGFDWFDTSEFDVSDLLTFL